MCSAAINHSFVTLIAKHAGISKCHSGTGIPKTLVYMLEAKVRILVARVVSIQSLYCHVSVRKLHSWVASPSPRVAKK